MALTVLLTGATGALGPHLLAELLRSDKVERIYAVVRSADDVRRLDVLWKGVAALSCDDDLVRRAGAGAFVALDGDLRRANLGIDDRQRARLEREVDVVVHAGADTRLAGPTAELRAANVEGTRQVLDVARRCQPLRQLILVSTACVAGTRTGSIAEDISANEPRFVNEYEKTKWQAERLAATSGLPVRVARLGTCIGSHRAGYVHRLGAIHHALRWFTRGLIPMLPGTMGSRLDLVDSDVAARWVARAVATPVKGLEVCHVAAGARAMALDELIALVAGRLRQRHPAWMAGQLEPPVIVGAETFDTFRRAVLHTGDSLLARVLEASNGFLPGLMYPKVYETARAERLWDGPLPGAGCREGLATILDTVCADAFAGRRELEASRA